MRRLAPALARLLVTCGALGLALLPHVAHFPLWVSAAVAGAIAWRLTAEHRGWALPPRPLKLIAALVATLAILAGYRTFNGLDAGTALLAIMAGLKLTETRQPRDHAVLVFIGYFLCLATLLYQESFARLLYTLVVAWLLTAALARVHRPAEANTPVRPFHLAARTLSLGLPLAAVLFVFVPRIEGRFWAVPVRSVAHTMGISDSMSPGDVAELSRSDDPAFRVWFEGALPLPEARYFRMLVLEEFDGRGWHRQSTFADSRAPEVVTEGPEFAYRIALEPTEREWLPGLDTVTSWPAELAARGRATQLVYFDRTILERRPVTTRLSYSLHSFPGASVMRSSLPRDLRSRDLLLPPGRSPRTVAFAAELRSANASDAALIERVLGLFRQAPFAYTLEPALLGNEPVDEFLFGTREGFCEHYASAFAVLMRAAGIPARVVIGYQGGEMNAYGGYLLVRQSHAHAWNEVWLEGHGWVRVDPTAAVAPERVRSGSLAPAERAAAAGAWYAADYGWLRKLGSAWDAARTAWYEGIVSFNTERQTRILAALGLGSAGWAGLAIALGLGFALAALALAGWLAWELRPRQGDRVQRAWLAACARLARLGLARLPAEGPVDFGRRVARLRPVLAPKVGSLVDAYVALRYLPGATTRERAEFLALVRDFIRSPEARSP